jgi:preprotein translocase subunit SecF
MEGNMINIISKRYWFFLISALIIVPGLISLIAPPHLNLGVDFKAGTTMTLSFSPAIKQSALSDALVTAGYPNASIQYSPGSKQYFVNISGEITPAQYTALQTSLNTSFNNGVTYVSHQYTDAGQAKTTAGAAVIAVIVAAVCIMIYIAIQFRKMPRPFRWGVCAVIALLHDLLVVLGIFSILGRYLGVQVDLVFITAVLTVAGYSVHDTIVVFDRIRENMLKGTNKDFEKTVDFSINETFVRSLNTSLTVLFVLFALFLLGGSTIHYFVLVLLIGVITGTYSSICNASALLVVWENNEWRRFISWIPGVSKNKNTETKAV